MQRHKVVGPLVLANVDGKVHYVYEGGLVPLGVDQKWIDNWLGTKLIEPIDSGPVVPPNVGELQARLAAMGVIISAEQAEAILAEQAATADADGGDLAPKDVVQIPDGAPHKDALKPAWVAFAVAQGMDQAEAEKATKADLIAALTAQA